MEYLYPLGKKKAITMSYDDGQVYDRKLVEIFNKYDIKGTFHLNSGNIDKERYLSRTEIKNLYASHEVSAHTVSHPNLVNLSITQDRLMIEEILEDKKALEDLVEYPVRGMSYPFGTYNKKVIETLKFLGIEYSRTIESHGKFDLPENFLIWNPTCHHNDNLLTKFEEFQNTAYWISMPLLFVWGHSHEFNRQNNWELIEEFCKVAGGREDIWYATNIEIYEYITAMRNLKFSVDRKLAYNPSNITIWVGMCGETIELNPGHNKIT